MHKSFRRFLPLAAADFGVTIRRFVPTGAKPTMELLFVYGTLQDPQIQLRAFGRTTEGTPDVLDGYRCDDITIDGSDYFIAVPDRASSIDGRVLELTPEELIGIDRTKAASTGGCTGRCTAASRRGSTPSSALHQPVREDIGDRWCWNPVAQASILAAMVA